MIIPSNSFWHKRDDNSSDNDSADSLSTQKQIIIGVVVGGVAFIAITAGIIFVFLKKRRFDRIQRYEERLLAVQLPPTYKANEAFPPDTPRPRPQSYHNPIREADNPPAYHRILPPSLPTYDPSKYQDVRPTSIIQTYHEGRQTSQLPLPPPPNRHTSIQDPSEIARHSALYSSRGPSPEDLSRPLIQPDSTGQLAGNRDSQIRSPRKPKPVLSRLITNFG